VCPARRTRASSARRRAAIRGLRHESWRVRRRCAQLLDDLELTEESVAALTERLADEHGAVRAAALHSLVCVGCKPDACVVDVRSVATPLLSDPSAAVRRQAVGAFHIWSDARFSCDDDDTVEMLRSIATTDTSARVRREAGYVVRDKELRREGDAARRSLRDDLRRKTLRHRGKWVAIADGRIISAHVFRGRLRRDMKGNRRPDALVVWVPPDADDADDG
jgi:HEAT repeat protein